jgi:general secretion pathway protein G
MRTDKVQTGKVHTGKARSEAGFTLIELLIVIAIIGIISGIAVAQMRTAPIRAKEAVLKEDLFALRDVIDQYFADKGKYPESLDTLIEDGYLRKIPVDPFTQSAETWETVQAEATDEDTEGAGGIIDVKSGADGTALDGTRYQDW